MANVKVTPNNLVAVMRGEIADRLVVNLRDRLEKNIIDSVPADIKDDPPINVAVTYSVNTSDGSMKLDVRVASETVTGVKEVQVSASSTFSAHTRVLDGKRNFYTGGYNISGSKRDDIRSDEGSFVTGNRIPEALLGDIVKHGIAATMSPSEHEGHSLDEHSRSGF